MQFKAKTKPKRWTSKEEKCVYQLYKQNKTLEEISRVTGRSTASLKNKIRRLKKKRGIGNYDKDHSMHKHLLNQRFLKQVNPKTVLDCYNAGSKQYDKYQVVTNDIDTKFHTTYHLDALDLIQMLYNQDKHFDLIDLDPYGSAFKLWKYAVQMADNGIIITLGELGHKRWNRLDFVGKHYGIKSMNEFTTNNIVKKLISIAYDYNVELKLVYLADYKYIARAYFIIK